MAIRDMESEVLDLIPVKNVLASVYDKEYLDELVRIIVEFNPDVRFLSTGGTYKRLREILGDSYKDNLMEVAEYTGFPEMEGGLVKTLHPKIHAGLLGERNNPEHQRYLREELDGGVFIDMAIVNLYPFYQAVTKKGSTFEYVRGNIDIGGPTIIRAGAKNFPSCAVVSHTFHYEDTIKMLRENKGSTTFDFRFKLAQQAFSETNRYDQSIASYLRDPNVTIERVRRPYKFKDQGEK